MTQPTPPSKGFDFATVESVRKQMLLTTKDMAKVFGVSRMTYYKWVSGARMHRTREDQIRKRLRVLLSLVIDHGWPTPEVRGMSQTERGKQLLALLEQYQ